MKKSFNKIVRYFLEGILVVVPFGLTIFFVCYPLNILSSFFYSITSSILGIFVAEENGSLMLPFIERFITNNWFILGLLRLLSKIPYMNLIVISIFITFLGVIASNFIIRSSIELVEKFIVKAPLLNILYSYIKESTSAFVGKFNKPVLVVINKELAIQKIGFVTQEDLHNMDISESKVAVFLPHSYAFSGELFFFPKKDVTPLSISTTEAMKVVLSGGLAQVSRAPMKVKKNSVAYP